MREIPVEEQIQWVLSYVQGGLVDIWKENILEDLERGLLEYKMVGKFLANIKKEFGEGDEKSVKVAELRELEQGGRTMKEFVQEFRRVERGSRYKRRLLIEEFKRRMNRTLCTFSITSSVAGLFLILIISRYTSVSVLVYI